MRAPCGLRVPLVGTNAASGGVQGEVRQQAVRDARTAGSVACNGPKAGLSGSEIELAAKLQQPRRQDCAGSEPGGAVGTVVAVTSRHEVRVEHVVEVDVRLQAAPPDGERTAEPQIHLVRPLVV